jgi:hypothetical protein
MTEDLRKFWTLLLKSFLLIVLFAGFPLFVGKTAYNYTSKAEGFFASKESMSHMILSGSDSFLETLDVDQISLFERVHSQVIGKWKGSQDAFTSHGTPFSRIDLLDSHTFNQYQGEGGQSDKKVGYGTWRIKMFKIPVSVKYREAHLLKNIDSVDYGVNNIFFIELTNFEKGSGVSTNYHITSLGNNAMTVREVGDSYTSNLNQRALDFYLIGEDFYKQETVYFNKL